jgi:hypothetical protein
MHLGTSGFFCGKILSNGETNKRLAICIWEKMKKKLKITKSEGFKATSSNFTPFVCDHLPSHLLPLKCFSPSTYTLPEPFATYLHSPPILSPLLSSSIEACHHDASPLRVLVITSIYYVLRCVINFIMDP